MPIIVLGLVKSSESHFSGANQRDCISCESAQAQHFGAALNYNLQTKSMIAGMHYSVVNSKHSLVSFVSTSEERRFRFQIMMSLSMVDVE